MAGATELNRVTQPDTSGKIWYSDAEDTIPGFLTPVQLLIPPSSSSSAQPQKENPIESNGTTAESWLYPIRQPDTVLDRQPTAH
jgi:hypothetical protein